MFSQGELGNMCMWSWGVYCIVDPICIGESSDDLHKVGNLVNKYLCKKEQKIEQNVTSSRNQTYELLGPILMSIRQS